MNIDKFRPIPFYFLNRIYDEDISTESIAVAMKELKEAGFGGCVLFNKPPDGFTSEQYLEKPWFDVVTKFAEISQQLKLQLWINDGFDFPPGAAGGRIAKVAPHLKQRRFRKNSNNNIEVTEADWGFPAFEEPESSKLFIEFVYEAYKREVGTFFGNGITGFFSDADARRFGHFAEQGMHGERYFPASINFLEIFKKEHCYELSPYLPDIIDGKGGEHALRYWELAEKLYANWFRNNYNWCRNNNLKYTFHSSDTGPFTYKQCNRSSIFTEGRYSKLAAYADYPGTDHELSELNGGKHFAGDGEYFASKAIWGGDDSMIQDPDFDSTFGDIRAKLTSSVAFILNRKRAVCEAFAATNWDCDINKLKAIACWQIIQGINFFIPHAVHHRLHGETKYFAPPDFSPKGSLSPGIRDFNDWLAKHCAEASEGELYAPIAVLNPTEAIWKDENLEHDFFEICDKLNKLPYGYVALEEYLLLDSIDKFKVFINPGVTLSPEMVTRLESSDCCEICSNQINDLEEILHDSTRFEGNGELFFMRRKLENKCEKILVTNLSYNKNISGKLFFQGHEFDISINFGEIEAFSLQQVNTKHDVLTTDIIETGIKFENFDIKWHTPNIIPLVAFKNQQGEIVDSSYLKPGLKLEFEWNNQETINDISLLVPATVLANGLAICLDNKYQLKSIDDKNIFYDKYVILSHTQMNSEGSHNIIFETDTLPSLTHHTPIYLSGDFGISLNITGQTPKPFFEYYNLRLYLPLDFNLSLAKAANTISTKSWTEQGRPFYSGQATYSTTWNSDIEITDAILNIPEIGGWATVSFNNEKSQSVSGKNGSFVNISIKKGSNNLEITVNNSLANMLEYYRAPSGLLKPLTILKINV